MSQISTNLMCQVQALHFRRGGSPASLRFQAARVNFAHFVLKMVKTTMYNITRLEIMTLLLKTTRKTESSSVSSSGCWTKAYLARHSPAEETLWIFTGHRVTNISLSSRIICRLSGVIGSRFVVTASAAGFLKCLFGQRALHAQWYCSCWCQQVHLKKIVSNAFHEILC